MLGAVRMLIAGVHYENVLQLSTHTQHPAISNDPSTTEKKLRSYHAAALYVSQTCRSALCMGRGGGHWTGGGIILTFMHSACTSACCSL